MSFWKRPLLSFLGLLLFLPVLVILVANILGFGMLVGVEGAKTALMGAIGVIAVVTAYLLNDYVTAGHAGTKANLLSAISAGAILTALVLLFVAFARAPLVSAGCSTLAVVVGFILYLERSNPRSSRT